MGLVSFLMFSFVLLLEFHVSNCLSSLFVVFVWPSSSKMARNSVVTRFFSKIRFGQFAPVAGALAETVSVAGLTRIFPKTRPDSGLGCFGFWPRLVPRPVSAQKQ